MRTRELFNGRPWQWPPGFGYLSMLWRTGKPIGAARSMAGIYPPTGMVLIERDRNNEPASLLSALYRLHYPQATGG